MPPADASHLVFKGEGGHRKPGADSSNRVLLLWGCVTLGRSQSLSELRFLICAMRVTVPALQDMWSDGSRPGTKSMVPECSNFFPLPFANQRDLVPSGVRPNTSHLALPLSSHVASGGSFISPSFDVSEAYTASSTRVSDLHCCFRRAQPLHVIKTLCTQCLLGSSQPPWEVHKMRIL